MFKKYVMLALAFFMLTSLVLGPISTHIGVATAPGVYPGTPLNPDYGTLKVDEPFGTFPVTLDPANCYDTVSAEAIFNSMETLIFYLGERYDEYQPMLATQVTVEPPSTTPDMHTGNVAPSYTDFTVDFTIRTGVPFQNRCRTDVSPAPTWGNFYLTTDDVGYTLQRFLVHDYVGAATWKWLEPLLDCHATPDATSLPPYDLANWGTKIQDAVQWDATDVWINIANTGLTSMIPPSFAPVNMFTNNLGNGVFRADPGGFYDDCALLPLNYPVKILMQVISQPFLSIMSKQWVLNYVNPSLPGGVPGTLAALHGNPADWDGQFSVVGQPMYWYDYNGWTATQSPEDQIPLVGAATLGVVCGTGPYVLDTYDAATGWSSTWYDCYWQGWWWPGASWDALWPFWWITAPTTWPPPGLYPPFWPWSVPPQVSPPYPPVTGPYVVRGGYVHRITIDNTKTNLARIADLKTGDVDLADVPSNLAGRLHMPTVPNPLGDRNRETLSGIRLQYPIRSLKVESFHYTFITDPTAPNTYGTIYTINTLGAGGIPANFFNVLDVREAMTDLQDIKYKIQTLMHGEAYQPRTFAPDGLPYVNPANPQYANTPNLAAAAALLANVKFGTTYLVSVGCDIPICYSDSPGGVIDAYCANLAANINLLGTTYQYPGNLAYPQWTGVVKAHTVNIAWNLFIPAMDAHELATFCIDWLPDYVDIHDYLFSYGDSQGHFARAQRYQNSAIDLLLGEAERLPEGLPRQTVYYTAELILYNDYPSVPILFPVERAYKRTWVQGWFYNPLYSGTYAYYLWKWTYIRGDVNYDDKVDMGDITAILDAFGSFSGRSGMPVVQPRWTYLVDIDGNPYESSPPGDGGWRDRKIDMYDVSAALANFGQKAIVWEIAATVTPMSHAHPVLLTCTAVGGNPALYTYQWYGNGVIIPGATLSTYMAPSAGNYACLVADGVQQSTSSIAYIT